MSTIFAVLTLFSVICVVYPIKPIKTRGQAIILAIFGFFMTGYVNTNKYDNSYTASYSGASTTSAPTPKTWVYDSSKDEMRNQETKLACIDANDSLYFSFPYDGGVTATLCLRKSPKFGNDVYLQITKGQFICGYGGCTINVKFSDSALQKFSAGEASDNSTNIIFIQNFNRFVSQLKKSKKTILEAEFYQEGVHQITFNTEGLVWQ